MVPSSVRGGCVTEGGGGDWAPVGEEGRGELGSGGTFIKKSSLKPRHLRLGSGQAFEDGFIVDTLKGEA
jgi:hypothetical protein